MYIYGKTFGIVYKNNTMKKVKNSIALIALSLLTLSMSQCKSTNKALEENTPFNIQEAYFQSWIAGVEGGGSGINVFIPVTNLEEGVSLEFIYFRNNKAKLEVKPQNTSLYIGYFLTEGNTRKADMIMSGNGLDEYGNEVPKVQKDIPFELKANEAIIEYNHNGEVKYMKVNLEERESVAYPSLESPKN